MSHDASANTGAKGEEQAANYLVRRGCEIIARNWRANPGEIDIVARCPDQTLAFVEVRIRHGRTGLAEESISLRKAASMTTAAYAYMGAHNVDPESTSWRIDVISIAVQNNRTILSWIKGAIPDTY